MAKRSTRRRERDEPTILDVWRAMAIHLPGPGVGDQRKMLRLTVAYGYQQAITDALYYVLPAPSTGVTPSIEECRDWMFRRITEGNHFWAHPDYEPVPPTPIASEQPRPKLVPRPKSDSRPA